MDTLPRVSVFGLGYVGSVTAACLAGKGCQVIGCDVSQIKVDQINAGEAPIGEPGLDELILEQQKLGRLRATTSAAEAVRDSEISFVCVGTPSSASGALDLQYVDAVAEQIAAAIQEKGTKHAVIFRSTMLPGSTEKAAESFFSSVIDEGLVELFFYPEFLRQGTALADFRNPSLSAIGVLDAEQTTESITSVLEPETEVMSTGEAELLKYACNAFHATKVSFANEIGRIGKSMGIRSTRVMETLCKDDRLNISSYYMRPGTPFGGSCLPKDVSALTQRVRSFGVAVPTLDSLLESNQRHLESLIGCVEANKAKRVLIIGLAFKAGTDDLRGSAMLELAASLLMNGYDVHIHDPDVTPRNLIGANQRFAAAKLPSLDSLLVSDIETLFGSEKVTVVVSKPCIDLDRLSENLKKEPNSHVIDVNGWAGLDAVSPSYEGLCW